MAALGDIVYRVPRSLPPYTRVVEDPELSRLRGHETAMVVQPDVAGALIELPRLSATGPDYVGLATEVDERGTATLWDCNGAKRKRAWRVVEW